MEATMSSILNIFDNAVKISLGEDSHAFDTAIDNTPSKCNDNNIMDELNVITKDNPQDAEIYKNGKKRKVNGIHLAYCQV